MSDKNVAQATKEGDKKRSKETSIQSSLHQFFRAPTKKVKRVEADQVDATKVAAKLEEPPVPDKSSIVATRASTESSSKNDDVGGAVIPDPIMPHKVSDSPKTVTWKTHQDCCLIRVAKEATPRTKVAGFDLDGTLMVWRSVNWPSRFDHYELWSTGVIPKLRSLYDEGYSLVVFTNQGGIQRALNGKKASFIKDVINWLAHAVDRPLHAVISTLSPNKKQYENISFHKPRPKMWILAETICNQKVQFDVEHSFYVGDSATDTTSDKTSGDKSKPSGQDAVDLRFAKNVGELRGCTLPFYTPDSYFGTSDHDKRVKAKSALVDTPPEAALNTRLALLGGYLKGPVLLILCGVQGCGKSTFCQQLLSGSSAHHWVHLCQDTINNGKPGKREKVEQEALAALESGRSVIIDRTNLDPSQRGYFIEVARRARCPVHAVLLNPPSEVVRQRVSERTDHPAGVQGEQGSILALSALSKLVIPKYEEGLDLISCTGTVEGTARICNCYKRLFCDSPTGEPSTSFSLPNGTSLPSRTLGTFKLGKRNATEIVTTALRLGFKAVDTAPTYNNEKQVGAGLQSDTFCILKVPLRAVCPEQVRAELQTSLKELNRTVADLLLLHWPSNVMSAGTLKGVWEEMEKCLQDGLCKALGVCNFNEAALATLLPHCAIRPVVNQIERHPLLPQADLLDYCSNQDILIQSHSTLGGGSSLLLQHPAIEKVANKTGMSIAQVLVQWNIQHGVPVVTKCSTDAHILEIINCKVLHSTDMKSLDNITDRKRFVTPPFMFGKAAYHWAEALQN